MKAGQTEFDVGTRIEVVSIVSTDPDEAIGVIGSVGELTHPFGDMPDTILGVYCETHGNVPPGVTFPHNRIGLSRGDRIRLLETGAEVTVQVRQESRGTSMKLYEEVMDVYEKLCNDNPTTSDLAAVINSPHRIADRGYVVTVGQLMQAIIMHELTLVPGV